MAEPYQKVVDIAAPVEEVFRHLTDPSAMVRWMGQHAVLEAHAGGRFEVDVNGVPVRGRYLEVEAPRRVVVTWGMAGSDVLPPGSTEVEFTLATSEHGIRLTLVHRNLPDDQVPQHEMGWGHFVARLATAATGADPGPDPWEPAAAS